MNWEQIRTILWLRWRLTKNQWARRGSFNAILISIVVVLCIFIGLSGAFFGFLIGALGMTKIRPTNLLVVWDFITVMFFFFWMIGVVSEIQRSETIDIGRIMYLPVSLKDIFLLNYFASYLTLSIILFLPAMLGLSLGLAVSRGISLLLMMPLVLGFVFMVTSWTYCLRGWLVRLMVNKRRRRAIIAGITVAFILLSQLPNLLTNVLPHLHQSGQRSVRQEPSESQPTVPTSPQSPERINVVLTVHKVVPILWVAYGAMTLVKGSIWPALFGAAGLLLIGILGLRRAYLGTIRFYYGQTESKRMKVKRPPVKQKAAAAKINLLEKPFSGSLQEAFVLAIVFFRSLKRAPEVKMGLASNMIILAIIGGSLVFRRSGPLSDVFKPFVISGAAAFTFFGMLQLFFNQFGYDRNGFRMLVLLPVERKYILLGKNLALMPIVIVIGLIFFTLIKFLLAVPLLFILAAWLQLTSAFLLLSMAGNFTSVMFPYRIAPGSLKPTKLAPMMTLKIILTHLLFPMMMFPLFIPPTLGLLFSSLGWLPAVTANILFSVIMLVPVAFLYRLSLRNLGDLLQQREKNILQLVTHEVE